VDAILIASPDAYHAEVAIAAIEAGKHVVIEKPMCITLNEADQIIAAQKRAQVTIQVGYMRRYAPAFVKACRLIGELGDIRLARVHDILGQNALFIKNTSRVVRSDDIPAETTSAGGQLRDKKIAEAIGKTHPDLARAYRLMLGLSSHDISAMREILGMPRRVLYAALRYGGMYISASFDYGTYVCHYETGINAIPKFDAHLEVYGNEKILRVEYNTPYIRNLPVRLYMTESNNKGGVIEHSEHPEWGDAFVAEWQAFYDNITGGLEPKTSPADFRKDLELFRDMIAVMRE
jgi:predicted dehydrogenase